MSSERFSPESPKRDVPAPSNVEAGIKVVGATCPFDNSFVTCSGARDAEELTGTCPVCKRTISADSALLHSAGTAKDVT